MNNRNIFLILPFFLALLLSLVSFAKKGAEDKDKQMNYNQLSPDEASVIIGKGTEPPFVGKYVHHKDDGTYVCKRCNAPLFRSASKFDSGSGWPSFDDAIEGAVVELPDADGRRTEIVCANCNGHLGHVFKGEGFTAANVRHCVNSLSLDFIGNEQHSDHTEKEVSNPPIPKVLNVAKSSGAQDELAAAEQKKKKIGRAIFAGGCFWGVEYYFEKEKGVSKVVSGYIGGRVENPSYKQVSSGNSGHVEAVEVTYDLAQTNYETLAKLFFEIHDPTQKNRQGPDVGVQYKSAIFYLSDHQRDIAKKLIDALVKKGVPVVTELREADSFWPAEAYHQNYYQRKGGKPYCHFRTKRF